MCHVCLHLSLSKNTSHLWGGGEGAAHGASKCRASGHHLPVHPPWPYLTPPSSHPCPPHHALAYQSRDRRDLSPAWQPQATLLEAVSVGSLEEEDLPAANCCTFLGLGGSPGSVGYIPVCDRVYQCSYRSLNSFLHLKTALPLRPWGPNTMRYSHELQRNGTLPGQAFPFFLPQ